MSDKIVNIENEKITLGFGLKRYDITDEYGRVRGTFEFEPGDTSIINRLMDKRKMFEEELPKIVEQMSATEDVEEVAALQAKADTLGREFLDEVFNADVSSAFFGRTGVLSSSGGEFLIFKVIDALVKVVEQHSATETKLHAARVKKHTSKYHK